MTEVNPQHSKATNRWGTPGDIVKRARHCMGGIDLDPCSEGAFLHVVNATKAYCIERQEDGLKLPWEGRVLLNPPGGLVREFWERIFESPCDQVVWIGFSVEQLCQLTDASYHPMDFSFCLPRSRIGFTRHDGYRASPSHGNYIAGINVDHDAFRREFSGLGRISAGSLVRLYDAL